MKIQFISNFTPDIKTKHNLEFSFLDHARTFDEFDINIISLQSSFLWVNNSTAQDTIDEINDLKSLAISIQNSKKATNIILLPQNYTFHFYSFSSKIKDKLDSIHKILQSLLPNYPLLRLVYEVSKTRCCNKNFEADFYFENKNGFKVITKNEGADHSTTIELDKGLICTTLNLLDSPLLIDSFIAGIGLDINKSEIPDWIKEIEFYDDKKQEEIIKQNEEEIKKLKIIIQSAENQIEKNLFYKSILYENGDALVKPVAEILELFTGVSLAGFVDEKKEDFKIILDDVTFIGEIKGITSNVKSEHISQLDVHCQGYIDTLQENGITENVKGLLIINPFRNKPLNEREEVHENQIKLAQRNGSLIITTEVFLSLFSVYLENIETSKKIIELLKTQTGILKLSDFIKMDE